MKELKKRPIHVSQIDLIGASVKYLDKRYGPFAVEPRIFNAIIAGANLIVEAFATPYLPATDGMGIDAWLNCDEVGKSSEFMARTLTGLGSAEYAFPRDADDFSRCSGLLRAEPKLVADLTKMATAGPEWERLVVHWTELEQLLSAGKREELYNLIQTLTTKDAAKTPAAARP